jgi:hypothetical protein
VYELQIACRNSPVTPSEYTIIYVCVAHQLIPAMMSEVEPAPTMLRTLTAIKLAALATPYVALATVPAQ